MEKRKYWPFSIRNFPQDTKLPIEPFEIDPIVMKKIFEKRFCGNPKDDPLEHLRKFTERCKNLKASYANVHLVKIKLFPYSLAGKALDWILEWPIENFSSWFNLKAAFVARFGSPEKLSKLREAIFSFK